MSDQIRRLIGLALGTVCFGAALSATEARAHGNRGTISGFVWEDANNSGVYDAGDKPLRDITIYLDDNDNGALDAGEQSTTSNFFGAYSFSGLADGDYNVRQVLPFGLRNTVGGEGVEVSSTIITRPPSAQIIGGTETPIDQFPFMAAMGFVSDGQFSQFCGGSIIADRWILTAGHCSGIDAIDAGVLVGTNDVTDGSGQLLVVRSVTRHPNFVVSPPSPGAPFSVSAGFDVALWELDTAIDLEGSSLNSVAMLHAGTALDGEGTLATAVGWGVSDIGSNLLQVVHVPIFNQEACHDVYSDSINFDTQVCGGAPEGGIDTCQGDSGGPFLVRTADKKEWKLAGATSYGNGCALPGNPGVYARVSVLSDWVEATAVEPSRVHRVTLTSRHGALASFGDRSTVRPKIARIAPRWQLTNLTTAATASNELDLSWSIIDESFSRRSFNCEFDADGGGPVAAVTLPCSAGANHSVQPGLEEGVYLPTLAVSLAAGPSPTFDRDGAVIIGNPPLSSADGELAFDDATDPDYPGSTYFIDYYEVQGLSGQKAISVHVTSPAFFPFVVLYDRDAREAGESGALQLFPLDDNGDADMAFFPEAGINYVIGVSSFGEEDTGPYTISVLGEGTPSQVELTIATSGLRARSVKDARYFMVVKGAP